MLASTTSKEMEAFVRASFTARILLLIADSN